MGTITSDGVYTAPNTAGKHSVRVTDNTLNKTSGATVTVFSSINVDFGSRTNQKYPIRAGILGVNHVDGLHNPTDEAMIAQAGVTLSRTYANLQTVYATQTPDWTKIDPLIANLSKVGMHVLLEIAYTPPWLQPNPNPCGAGNFAAAPTNDTTWGQLAASFVAHMDANFPGVVTDYEIWNEPNTADGLCVSSTSNKLNTYLAIYAAAAPLMKQRPQRMARLSGLEDLSAPRRRPYKPLQLNHGSLCGLYELPQLHGRNTRHVRGMGFL